jgi:hypothetical protein
MTPEQLKLLQELAKLGDVLYLTKPKNELIVDAIASMNISALKILLDDNKTYINTTKDIFLDCLSNLFEDFKNYGDTELVVNNGLCGNKSCSNCGVKGYRFIGEKSKKYFDFIFEMDGEDVKEISDCFVFKTNIESEDLGEQVYIEIDHDDRVDFEKTAEYLDLYDATMKAYSEIAKTPPLLLDLEGLSLLVAKYADLYKSIDENEEYNCAQMKWRIFLDIYYSLRDINEFMNSNLIDIFVANNLFEQITNEQALIDWVLKNETVYNQIPLEIVYLSEEDNILSCILSSKVNFVKEPFEQVLKYITSYKKREKQLLEKYNIYTKEEHNEAYESEAHLNNGSDLFSLKFHINKRKKLKEIGIILPFYLGRE